MFGNVLKTIVSTELVAKICEAHNVKLHNVLTGFKFIGEQITLLAEKNEQNRYIFGYEESYGYLAGSYARDKDGVVASMLICEMTAFYKNQGKTLYDVLQEIYKKYGYCYSVQKSFTCEGRSGIERIKQIMEDLRKEPLKELDNSKVIKINDYEKSVSLDTKNNTETVLTLPKSNVLSFFCEDGSSLIVRPSGTEPKIKIYVGAVGENEAEGESKKESLLLAASKLLGF